MKWLVAHMWMGMTFTIVTVATCAIGLSLTGPIYGIWDWPEVAAVVLVLGVLVLGGLVEAVRPQNPYTNVNPLYGMKDAGPTGTLHSGGWGWLVQVVPPIVAALALIVLV